MNPVDREAPSICEFYNLVETDRVVVRYFPEGEGRDANPEMVLTDSGSILALVELLRAVPSKGPGMMMKLAGDAPEIHLEFFDEETALGKLRIKAGMLSAPGDAGWSFYANEDSPFLERLGAVISESGWEIDL